MPLTFLILLLAFGAFVAAGMPVLLALSAVLASIGLSSLVSHLAHATTATSSVILLIGMAVGVDYSLFYVKREREERAAGHEGREALHRAAATSGQAVLISGATVMVAMAGMLLAGSAIFTSLGIGAMIVVFSSVVGSLTVLPALLGKLGDRIDRGVSRSRRPEWVACSGTSRASSQGCATRRTLIQRIKGTGRSRACGARPAPSLRHPAVATIVSAGFLVLLALPAFGMHTKLLSFNDLPRKPDDRPDLRDDAGGVPRLVVARDRRRAGTERDAPGVRGSVATLQRRGARNRRDHEPITDGGEPAHTVARIDIPLVGNDERPGRLPRTQRAAAPCRARDRRSARRRPVGRDGRHRGLLRLQRDDPLHAPVRVRLRARAGVRPAAADVPLDRDPASRRSC